MPLSLDVTLTAKGARRYGVALAVVLLALAIRWALVPIIGNTYPFLVFFPAVLIATWVGGRGPGVFSLALSFLLAVFLFGSPHAFLTGHHPEAFVGLTFFLLTGLLFVYLNELRTRHAEQASETERKLRESQAALQVAYERERRISETLQRSLLMTPAESQFEGLAVEAFYEPASNEAMVGGDFFDAFSLSGDKVALVVGDVSGKGLAAATHTAEIKFALRAILREHPHPASALVRLNNVVCESQELDRRAPNTFVAVCLAVVDPKTGHGQLAMAGSEPALLIRRRRGMAEPETEETVSEDYDAEEMAEGHGIPLCVESKFDYFAHPIHLNRLDTFLMLTDGITEARRKRDFLGYDGMVNLAREAALRATLREMGQAILDGARSFAGGRLQDDACLLLARRV